MNTNIPVERRAGVLWHHVTTPSLTVCTYSCSIGQHAPQVSINVVNTPATSAAGGTCSTSPTPAEQQSRSCTSANVRVQVPLRTPETTPTRSQSHDLPPARLQEPPRVRIRTFPLSNISISHLITGSPPPEFLTEKNLFDSNRRAPLEVAIGAY